MKCITYSLFGDPLSFEFNWYLRGVYFNARMNRLIYPDWQTLVFIERSVLSGVTDNMHEMSLIKIIPMPSDVDRCEGMLWRMLPLFGDYTHVLCRDADAVTTYREAICVSEWLSSDLQFHGINDNPAHCGLMGGMTGFRSNEFKKSVGHDSFYQMISGLDLRQHGSDQNFMNKSIHPKIKNNLLMHVLSGGGCEARHKITSINERKDIGIDKRLWESSNTCRFIGSPGVVDFELLRFFKRFDNDPKYDKFEREFPDIFYWQR